MCNTHKRGCLKHAANRVEPRVTLVPMLNISIGTGVFYLFIGCVGPNLNFGTLLIGAEGTKTPAGGRGWGDPAGALAPRRLPVPPAESEVPGDPINRTILTQPLYH